MVELPDGEKYFEDIVIIRRWYTGRWWVDCYIWYSKKWAGCGPAQSPPKYRSDVPLRSYTQSNLRLEYMYRFWEFFEASRRLRVFCSGASAVLYMNGDGRLVSAAARRGWRAYRLL